MNEQTMYVLVHLIEDSDETTVPKLEEDRLWLEWLEWLIYKIFMVNSTKVYWFIGWWIMYGAFAGGYIIVVIDRSYSIDQK